MPELPAGPRVQRIDVVEGGGSPLFGMGAMRSTISVWKIQAGRSFLTLSVLI